MKNLMKSILIILALHLLLASMAISNSRERKEAGKMWQDTIHIHIAENIDLFDKDEPLNIIFVFNMRDFLKGKKDPEYVKAVMTLHMDGCDPITQDLRIRARGNYRRSVCDFPPILINPRENDSALQIISKNRNIKLVTHCRNETYYENYVLKEYLVYKLYNLITNYSFRVRLAKINYIDEKDPDDIISRYGFLIENVESMAERNNAIVLDNERLKQKDMIPLMMARMSVFEFMIGNLDWQLGKPHNIETIKALDIFTDKAIPVPYDFDLSGLVDIPYATVRKDLGLKTVRQRAYLGTCAHQDQWNNVLNEFEALKDTFYEQIISHFKFLNNKSKQEVISYLDEFYKLIHDRDYILHRLYKECVQESNQLIIIK